MQNALTLFTGMSNLGYRYGATEQVVVSSAHEAGHVVAGLALGLRITGAEVFRRAHPDTGRAGEVYCHDHEDARHSLYAVFLAGGHAGEQFVDSAIRANVYGRNRGGDLPKDLDLQMLREIGHDRDLEPLMRHAVTILNSHRSAFERITIALMQHGRLNEGDIRTLAGAPLADSWVHADAYTRSSTPSPRAPLPRPRGRNRQSTMSSIRYGDPIEMEVR